MLSSGTVASVSVGSSPTIFPKARDIALCCESSNVPRCCAKEKRKKKSTSIALQVKSYKIYTNWNEVCIQEQPMDNNDINNICLLLLYNFEETGLADCCLRREAELQLLKKIKIKTKIKIWACDHKLID